MEKLLRSVSETEQLLDLGHSTLNGLLQSGELPSLKLGRRRLVPQSAIEEFIRRQMAAQKTPETSISAPVEAR